MAQGWAAAFYHSPAWRKNRANYMKRPLETLMGTIPPGMCERCFERGELTPAKVVHHKTHLTPSNIDDPHITLNYNNFQRLCQDCHAEVHSATSPSRARFDENGRPIPARRGVRDFSCLNEPDRNRYDSKERHDRDMP